MERRLKNHLRFVDAQAFNDTPEFDPRPIDDPPSCKDGVIIEAKNVNKFDVRACRRRRPSENLDLPTPADRSNAPLLRTRCIVDRVGCGIRPQPWTGRGNRMSDAAFGEDTRMRMEALRRQLRLSPRAFLPDLPDDVLIRQLRGATEYRGRRDRLIASGHVLTEWLPAERLPGQRTRATLHARDGGRDVFARRLEDGRICVLVIHTPLERVTRERFAFERFLRKLLTRR